MLRFILAVFFVVVLSNFLCGCASSPPTPATSGAEQVDAALVAAARLPADNPATQIVTSALQTCRSNLVSYETAHKYLQQKLDVCTTQTVNLSRSAGKGDGYTFLLWVVLGLALGYFVKWGISRVWAPA